MSSPSTQPSTSVVKTQVVKKAIVLGSGLCASVISLEIANQGFDVDLLMSGNELINLDSYSFSDEHGRRSAVEKMKIISSSPRIRLHRDCMITSIGGFPGDFEITFNEAYGNGNVRGGAIVLALDPSPSGIGQSASIVTNAGIRGMIENDSAIPRVVVFIEGSGTTSSCPIQGTTAFIENALSIKKKRPDAQVYILARDVGAPGFFERTYQIAQEKGIVFFRGDLSYRQSPGGSGSLIIIDPVVGEVNIRPDIIVRDEAFDLGSNPILARKLGLYLSHEGQPLRFNTRLHPGETIREGIFVCRGLGASILASENISEACAVASSASELLSKGYLEHGAEVAFVDKEKCSACLACVRICPYDAPLIDEKGKAEIQVARCQACGICVSLCPSKAIDQRNWTDAQLSAQIVIASKGGSR